MRKVLEAGQGCWECSWLDAHISLGAGLLFLLVEEGSFINGLDHVDVIYKLCTGSFCLVSFTGGSWEHDRYKESVVMGQGGHKVASKFLPCGHLS